MEKPGIRRRGLLQAGVAASTLVVAPSTLRAQAKLAPPNIIKAGTLVMSINPTLPPLQYVDDKGQLQGMRVELANECCKILGLAPEYISFLSAKGNPLGLKTVDDLAGKRISVELGGIEERRTREVNDIVTKKGLKPVTVMTFNNFAEAFQTLKAGQSDAATCIDATAKFQEQRGDFTRAISGVFPQTACFAFANKVLADAVVGTLNQLRKNGTYDKLLDQYGVLKIDEPAFSIKGPGPA
jgi:polar amino acid transport system substrate-binding protein